MAVVLRASPVRLDICRFKGVQCRGTASGAAHTCESESRDRVSAVRRLFKVLCDLWSVTVWSPVAVSVTHVVGRGGATL